MKNKLITAIAACCLIWTTVIVPSWHGFALVNDARYDFYTNMKIDTSDHAKYVVPSLYRQDSSYINVKTFPLVVNGGVEYFPLDIFAHYSYLKVVYSRLTDGFYINNTKNNHYVAFDVNTGTTTTHDEQMLDIQAKIFYRTYYVPARKVCEILGMRFETYDNFESGIRAARISDNKSKITIEDLISDYLPSKNTYTGEDNGASGNVSSQPGNKQENSSNDSGQPNTDNQSGAGNDSSGTPNNSQPNSNTSSSATEQKPSGHPEHNGADDRHPKKDDVKTENEEPHTPSDPFVNVAVRRLHLTFNVSDTDVAERVLDLLYSNGIKAVFFADKQTILSSPDTVRRILAEGHSAGILFDAVDGDGNVLDNESIIARINEVNDALYLVSKVKTRYVRAKQGSDLRYTRVMKENKLDAFTNDNGYDICDWSIDSGDTARYRTSQLDSLTSAVAGQNTRSEKSLFIKFDTEAGTYDLLKAFIGFVKKYRQFNFSITDEYTRKVSFIGK